MSPMQKQIAAEETIGWSHATEELYEGVMALIRPRNSTEAIFIFPWVSRSPGLAGVAFPPRARIWVEMGRTKLDCTLAKEPGPD